MLETAGMNKTPIATLNACLYARALLMNQCILMDAIHIAAPASTKKQVRVHDAEMGHTHRGKQYYFGAKANLG